MDHRLASFLLLAAGTFCIPSASAQNAEIDPVPSTELMSGYQTERSGDGFKLVTLGIWSRPKTAPSPEKATQVSVSDPPTRPGASSKSKDFHQKLIEARWRRSAYLAHVNAAEVRYGLPAGLLDALIWTESRYNPFAVSRAGATGLGQLMPSTARDLGVLNQFDARANLWAAARYLRQLLDKFGMVHLALAAYNAGPGAVERAGGIPHNGETPAYVRNVLASWGAR
jgi:soluble lytic murein transglycosylase-like protein